MAMIPTFSGYDLAISDAIIGGWEKRVKVRAKWRLIYVTFSRLAQNNYQTNHVRTAGGG